jgi:hypothetical protein
MKHIAIQFGLNFASTTFSRKPLTLSKSEKKLARLRKSQGKRITKGKFIEMPLTHAQMAWALPQVFKP